MRPINWTAAAGALCLLGLSPDTTVRYRLAPEDVGGELKRVSIELRLKGDADGSTALTLPERGDAEDPWPATTPLRVEGARLQPGAGAGDVVLQHRPGRPIRIRYAIPAGGEDPGPEAPLYRPIVRPSWFHLIGEAAFVVPEGRGEALAAFSWGGRPSGWRLVSDMEADSRSAPLTVADVIGSVTLGGRDLRVTRFQLDGRPLRIASRGEFPFTHEQFGQEVLAIARAVNAFWGEGGRPYLVTLIPFRPFASSEGTRTEGAGRDNAFAFGATTDLKLAERRHTLAHEYLHTWIPFELGDWREAPDPSIEALDKWFGEGFADFYASRLLLRGGVWSLEDFVSEWNYVLDEYAASPVRTASNTDLAARYYKDGDHRDLAYRRGALFAALLDGQLRTRAAFTLDDVMRELHRRAGADRRAGRSVPAGPAFAALLGERAPWTDDLLKRHIEGGEPIILPPGAFGPCIAVQTRPSRAAGQRQRLALEPGLSAEAREACAAR